MSGLVNRAHVPGAVRVGIPAALALALAFVVAGCNTMEGMGQDIKAGGSAIERTATEVKGKM